MVVLQIVTLQDLTSLQKVLGWHKTQLKLGDFVFKCERVSGVGLLSIFFQVFFKAVQCMEAINGQHYTPSTQHTDRTRVSSGCESFRAPVKITKTEVIHASLYIFSNSLFFILKTTLFLLHHNLLLEMNTITMFFYLFIQMKSFKKTKWQAGEE